MKLFCPQCSKVFTVEVPENAQEANCPQCASPLPVPQTPLSPGAVIGDFLLEKALSSGGMGVVYLARQISLDRPVALKVLHDKFAGNQEYTEGLFREARAAAKLTHPNIVQAYAVGEENAITDYYINITATSSTAVVALADEVAEKMSERGKRPSRIEGRSGAAWILVDFTDVILNVFDRQSREFYDIDRLMPADRKMDIEPIKAKVDEKFNLKNI